ncbi:hypothetical protein SpCBS45565_g07957 [Spizellomyces sp. 'palustris']|nr:hypothetical protein SpCBS45565_g07957 [Spizellomyces sp. 'palustris']
MPREVVGSPWYVFLRTFVLERNLTFDQFAGKGILKETDATWPPTRTKDPLQNDRLNQTVAFEKESKKPRKSLGRRVSFAPKAHIRPFKEDSDKWDDVLGSGPLFGDGGITKFEMPDLSSVRRNSGIFNNIRLSLGADSHEDTSYEVDLKGPADAKSSADETDSDIMMDDETWSEDIISISASKSAAEPVPQNSIGDDSKRRPRDSIAAFFQHARPHHEPVLAETPVAPPPGLVLDKRRMPRDSIAAFFQQPDDESEAENVEEPHAESDDDIEMATEDPTQASVADRILPDDIVPTEEAEWTGYPAVPVEETRLMENEKTKRTEEDTAISMDVSLGEGRVSPRSFPKKEELVKLEGELAQGDLPASRPGHFDIVDPFEQAEGNQADDPAHPSVLNCDPVDDTIAGFFTRVNSNDAKNKDEAAPEISSKSADNNRVLNQLRTITHLEDRDDTIGRFFFHDPNTNKGGMLRRALEADSSDEESHQDPTVAMDLTECVTRVLGTHVDDTTSTTGSVMSNTPTRTATKRRRSSVSSVQRLSNSKKVAKSASVEAMPSPIPTANTRQSPGASAQLSLLEEGATSRTAPSPFRRPSFASEFAGDTSLAGIEDVEDDLMNEHLSMLDDSLMEEAEPNAVATVKEFLQATGIYFQDNLTTSFRRETNAYLRTSEQPTDIDYYKAALLWSSELDTYEFGCKELQKYIEDIREELIQIEEDAEANVPPIFFDVVDGTSEERALIQRQLKATRSITRAEAKESWHVWRANLLNNLSEDFTCNLERLEKDERIIQKFADRTADMMTEGQGYRSQKMIELESARNRLADEEQRDNDRLVALKRREAEQQARLLELKAESEQLRLLCDQEQARESDLLRKKDLLCQAIEKAENICKELMIFDPEELSALRSEYKLLTSMFPWTSVHIASNKYILAYDNAVEVAFIKVDGNHFGVELSVSEPKKPSVLSILPASMTGGRAIVDALGHDSVCGILKNAQQQIGICHGPKDFSRVINHAAYIWNGLRKLYHDIELAREEYDIKCVRPPAEDKRAGRGDHLLGLHLVCFCRKTHVRFEVTLWVAGDGKAEVYPSGRMDWDVNITYGGVSRKEIDDILSAIPAAPGRLMHVLRELDRMTRTVASK